MSSFFILLNQIMICFLVFFKLMKTKRFNVWSIFRLLWKGNWFIQEKSCKILALIVRYFKFDPSNKVKGKVSEINYVVLV